MTSSGIGTPSPAPTELTAAVPTTTVVVPLDGSAGSLLALQPATWIARRCGAELRLVTTSYASDTSSAHRFLVDAAHTVSGVAVSLAVPTHTFPYDGILAEAGTRPGRLLVMSTHGRTGMGRFVLGSTAEDVIRSVRIPVVLVGPSCRPVPDGADELLVCRGDAPDADALRFGALATSLRLVANVVTVGREVDDAAEVIADGARPNVALLAIAAHTRGYRPLAPLATDVVRRSPWPVAVLPTIR